LIADCGLRIADCQSVNYLFQEAPQSKIKNQKSKIKNQKSEGPRFSDRGNSLAPLSTSRRRLRETAGVLKCVRRPLTILLTLTIRHQGLAPGVQITGIER
jgi:hypothetical protein